MYSHIINIDSDIKNIGSIESIALSIIDKFSLSQEKFPAILIATTEAVSNAIIHGNKEKKDKAVEIYAKLNQGDLYIQVKDQGDGFDFTDLPDPTTPESIEEEGGRGILLINELCDEYQFRDGGCTIEMLFKK